MIELLDKKEFSNFKSEQGKFFEFQNQLELCTGFLWFYYYYIYSIMKYYQ